MLAVGMKVKINPDAELPEIQDVDGYEHILNSQKQGIVGIITGQNTWQIGALDEKYPWQATFDDVGCDFAEHELIVVEE